jgi:hypothetical protein
MLLQEQRRKERVEKKRNKDLKKKKTDSSLHNNKLCGAIFDIFRNIANFLE